MIEIIIARMDIFIEIVLTFVLLELAYHPDDNVGFSFFLISLVILISKPPWGGTFFNRIK